MSLAEFVRIEEMEPGHHIVRICAKHSHECVCKGEPLHMRFTLHTATNHGTADGCRCQVYVPEPIWNRWRERYEFAQRLEGK